jgi:tetrahydromethanopterin S-methyltransferase subunit H
MSDANYTDYAQAPMPQAAPIGSGKAVRVRAGRTFSTKVHLYLGRGADNKPINHVFDATFKMLPTDEAKRIIDEERDGAFVRAAVVSADVLMEDERGNPMLDQIEAMANDPAVSTALVTAYFREMSGKNDNMKK